jgi:CoA-transferase family III
MRKSLKIPLSGWADGQIAALARATGCNAIARLNGAVLLGERAASNGFTIPGIVSAGGGSRLYKTRRGWVSLSLARISDREMLPALFCDASLDPEDDDALAERMMAGDASRIVDQGTTLGLSIARVGDTLRSPAWEVTVEGLQRQCIQHRPPLVVDLASLWAGPLATHLIQLAGATVLKVESSTRPDAMREGDAPFFNLLNQNKASIALDFGDEAGRKVLLALIHKADIVVESSRPRALLQLGIDADALVRDIPGLVWMSITAHGVHGNAANRIGFGDDCGVAGGLTAALINASGHAGFVGDAIADPLAGITAARLAWERWQGGKGGRVVLSMSGIVAQALTEDDMALDELGIWSAAQGAPFPDVIARAASQARPLGADTEEWLTC